MCFLTCVITEDKPNERVLQRLSNLLPHLVEALALASGQQVGLQLACVHQDRVPFKPKLLQQVKLERNIIIIMTSHTPLQSSLG